MREVTASDIKKELFKIAFFIQHSGLFDAFSPATRRTLESLPVEWESVQIDGETHLKWKDEPTWAEADLSGKLGDDPVSIKIKRSSSRNIYVVSFQKKRYTVENMTSLKNLFDDLQEGKTPKPKLMQKTYNTLNQKKIHLNTQSRHHYLNTVSSRPWKIDISKDSARIFVRFWTPAKTEEEKQEFDKKLEEQNKFRLNSVGSFIKKILQKEDINIDDLVFTHRLLNVSGKSGFLITIK